MRLVMATMLPGLLASRLLFYRFPGLKRGGPDDPGDHRPRLSIIIPARNEEQNLALLLGDLQKQTAEIFEIICVDDGSTDATAAIAAAFGARLISAPPRPAGWLGKAWACAQGAKAARGELLLFLDADVRLRPAGLLRLLQTAQQTGTVVSVMPYHQIKYYWEAFSLFFNCIQLAANGLGWPAGHFNSKPGHSYQSLWPGDFD